MVRQDLIQHLLTEHLFSIASNIQYSLNSLHFHTKSFLAMLFSGHAVGSRAKGASKFRVGLYIRRVAIYKLGVEFL